MPADSDTMRYPRSIMGTCCVPWTADYTFDERMFRRAVTHITSNGTKHLYIFGTAGEGHAVSTTQFKQITRTFADEMTTHGCEPMVGVISLSLSEVLDRIEWAGNLGVKQFQVSLPAWGTCTPDEALTFFEQVCMRFPDFRFMHYNLKRSGRLLNANEYGRLAEALPNLVAVKMAGATGEDARAVQDAAPSLRLYLTEKAFAEAGALGVEAGLLVSYASMSWRLAWDYYAAVVAGEPDAVAAHRAQQTGVIELLRETTGDAAHMDGAFDLMFIKRHLPEFPLRLLPPYAAVGDEGYARFLDAVRTTYPEWVDDAPAGPNGSFTMKPAANGERRPTPTPELPA